MFIIIKTILILVFLQGSAFSETYISAIRKISLIKNDNITNKRTSLKSNQTSSFKLITPPDQLILEEFFKATEARNLKKAKELILDLDINTRSWSGISPLYQSVFYNNFDLVHLLLKRGADVNLSDHEGLTPLHVAALENFDYMINKIEKGF